MDAAVAAAPQRIIYQVVAKEGDEFITSPPPKNPCRNMTIKDALLECAMWREPIKVLRVNLTTGAVDDVSKEVAAAWWKIQVNEFGDDPSGHIPPFIRLHLTDEQMWAEIVEG